jgi:Chaperone of endosialidase
MRSEYSVRAAFLLIFLPLLFRPAALTAQDAQGNVVPLKNWAAPLYWKPNQAEREIAGGVTPKLVFSASQVSPSALTFVAVTPCRLVDTRGSAAGFNGLSPFSGPSLAPSSTVTFPVQSAAEAMADTTPTPCGTIPSIAQAYSFNVTVVPKTAGGIAFVTVWQSGGAQPAVSTLNDGQGLILANAAIVPAGTPSGGINVVSSGPATMDLIIDMNGFYAAPSDLNGNTAVGSGALVNDSTGSSNTASGSYALTTNTTGGGNTATGVDALVYNTAGNYNTASGVGALQSNTNGSNNTASGTNALEFNTTGGNNTASGYEALANYSTPSENTAVGYQALQGGSVPSGNTGAANTGVGALALQNNSTGNDNAAIGLQALGNNTTGSFNAAAGNFALLYNTTGGSNAASGYAALADNSTGGNNTAIGANALGHNTAGSGNIAVGNLAAFNVSGGNANNIHIGSPGSSGDNATIRIGTIGTQTSFFAAGVSTANLAGDTNAVPVVIDATTGQLGVGNSSAGGGITGVTAGTDLTGGGTSGTVTLNLDTTKVPTLAGANTFTGANGFTSNINMGASLLYQGSPVLQVQVPTTLSNSNIALGIGALQNNTTGSYNTASGSGALLSNTTGSENTGVGVQALANYSTASGNAAVGYQALQGGSVASANTGGNNTATGTQTLENNTTGSNNTASGYQALNSNTTGYNNTAIGELALFYNSTGCCNIAIGPNAANLVSAGNSGNIHIGSQGASGDSGTIRIGTAQTTFFAAGIYGVGAGGSTVVIDSSGQLSSSSSSRRYKEDIQDMSDASRGLMDLRPVTFRYKKAAEDGSKPLQYGLIAEEVAEVYPDLVVYKGGQPDAVQYQMLPAMLLNEVQKQSQHAQQQDKTIRQQREQVAQQQEQIRSLEARLAALEGLLLGKGPTATAGR